MDVSVTDSFVGEDGGALARAAAHATSALLCADGAEQALGEALSIVGEAMGADCVVLLRGPDGEPYAEWVDGGDPGHSAAWTGARAADLRAGASVVAEDGFFFPVFVGADWWGALYVRQPLCERVPAEDLDPFVRALGGWLRRRRSWQDARRRTSERRLSMERVLAGITTLFVSPTEVCADDLLRAVGQAMKADHVYLITAPADEHGAEAEGVANRTSARRAERFGWPVADDDYTYQEWYASRVSEVRDLRSEAFRDREEWTTFAVPVLSSKGGLYGYLGIEYGGRVPEWLVEEKRLLDVLGDVLSAYLERQMAEVALRASEERYRSFVSTISEGIWCIEPVEPIPVDATPEEQLALVRESLVTECNEGMRCVLGVGPQEAMNGRSADLLPSELGARLFADMVEKKYQLRNEEYSVHEAAEMPQHFVTSAVGVVEDGYLVRVWASWTDVTARVEIERRMVTALEQQQQRIGHELHDGVGQLITSVRMLSQNLAERCVDREDKFYQQVQRIVRFTEEATQLLSELQRGLAPVQVKGRGLALSLEQLARNTDSLPGVSCQYEHDGVAEVEAGEAKLQLYRIAQEATNNALKHAGPSMVHIAFRRIEDHVVLVVRDNGTGFDVESHRETSLGLHSMEYRARSIGAHLVIDSVLDRGTAVRCELPVEVA